MSGIGWYEAAAYAEFVEKSLPTVYHWNRAAGIYDSSVARMIMNSNFGASGSAPVGKLRGISPFGAFDMTETLGSGFGTALWVSNISSEDLGEHRNIFFLKLESSCLRLIAALQMDSAV